MLKDIIKAALTVAAISTGMAAFTGAIAAAGITAKAYFMRQFVAYTALIGLNAITAKGTNNTSRKNLGIKQAGLNSIAARNIVYGKNRVGGTIVFRSTSGTNNSKLNNLIALAGHEINDLKKIFIDGGKGLVELDLTSDFSTVTKNGETVHRVTNTAFINTDNPQAYSGGALIELTFEKGDQTTANGYVKDQIGFTNDHKLQGIAYVYINCIFDTEKFASYPNFSFEVEGKKVYDPVTATTVYSTNPALIIRDYLMDSTYGFGAISDEINDATTGAGFVKARSDCNDSVTITGGTESRYTLNGQFDSTEEPQQVLQHMLSACAGQLLYNNGKFSLFVGKERTASGTITDDKLLAPISITTKASGQDLANGVKASYVRPSDNYIAGEITPYQDSTYLSADTPSGQQSADYENYMDLSFPFTQSTFTAQRLARIALDYQRQDQTLTAIVPLEFMTHQVGDIINFTNDRLGYSGKDFEIVAMGFEFIGDNYLALRLNLKEYSTTVFDNITYVADPTLPSPPSAGDNTVGTPTGLTLTESSKNTTAKEIYIRASWTNDDDDKIVATEVAFKKSTDSEFSSNYTSYPRTTFTFRAESSTTYNFKVRHISSTGVAGGYTSVVNITTSADVGTFTDGTIAGITVATDKLYEGTGTFNNSNTGFYLDNTGQFSLKDKLSFDGTTLNISGNLTVENTITADKIVVDGINLDNLISATTQSGSIYLTEFTGIKIATAGATNGYPALLRMQDDQGTNCFTDITQSQTGINIRARANTAQGTIRFQGIGSGITPVNYGGFDASGNFEIGTTDVIKATRDIESVQSIALDSNTPSTTTNKLYQASGTLYWNGNQVGVGAINSVTNMADNRVLTASGSNSVNGEANLTFDGSTLDVNGNINITEFIKHRGDADTYLQFTDDDISLFAGGIEFISMNEATEDTITLHQNTTASGNLIVSGDLTVNGTTTTINTATLDVEDKNITLNYGAGDTSASANGAGITIQDAVSASTDATILWNASADRFDFSHGLRINADSQVLTVGADGDFSVSHNGTDTFMANSTGHFYITTTSDDKDIIFRSDDGSGGVTSYFRLDGGLTKTVFPKDTRHNDSVKALFGTSSDLEIYHDGSNSYIADTGTGSLILKSGSTLALRTPADENMIHMTVNDAVKLYYDNSEKLATTSTGIDVTGAITSSGNLILGANGIIDTASGHLIFKSGGATQGQFISTGFSLIGSYSATGNYNTSLGSYQINGQTVIDSSRNLVNIGTISSGAITSSGTITAGSGGSASSPIITFSGDTDTGIYRTAANQLAFTTAGTQALKLDGSQNATFAGNATFSGVIGVGGTSTNSNFGVYLQNNKWYATQYSSSHDIVRMNANTSGGLDIYNQTDNGFANVRVGSLNIGSTTVIDSSRNLTNIGTISSGAITSSGTSSFDATDIAQIEIGDGGANTATDARNIGSKSNYLVIQRDQAVPIELWGSSVQSRSTHYFGGGTSDAEANIDTSGNFTTTGTISSGGITSSGTIVSNPASSEGGQLTLRANSGGAKQYSWDVDSSNNLRLIAEDEGTGANGFIIMKSSGGADVDLQKDLKMVGTLVMNQARNMTNIGSISSGAITSSGVVTATSTSGHRFGRLTLRDDAVEEHQTDTDGAGVTVNYVGYNGGTTRFRSLNIFDGKQQLVGNFSGSNKTLNVVSGYKLNGTTVIDSSRNLTNIGTISSGQLSATTSADATPAIIATNSGGVGSTIQRWVGDTDSLEVKNIAAGDYKISNSQQDNAIVLYDGSGGVEIFYGGSARQEWDSSGGTNLVSGSYKVGGTAVIDSTRNLVNIGTISSGAITSSGNVTANGGTLTASSTGGATLTLEDSGSHLFRIVAENNVNSLNFKEGGNNTIMSLEGSNRRVGIGTSSPATLLHLSANDPTITLDDSGTSSTITGQSGNILYKTSSTNRDHVFYGVNNEKFRVTGDGLLQVGSSQTTILDASRNLSNIGTISSTNISSNGSAVVVQSKPLTVVGQPINISAPNSAEIKFLQTTSSTTASKGSIQWFDSNSNSCGTINLKADGGNDNSGIMEFYVTAESDEIGDEPFGINKVMSITEFGVDVHSGGIRGQRASSFYNSTSTTLTTSYATVTLNQTATNTATSLFQLASNVVTIKKAGTYMIMMEVTTDVTSGGARSESQAELHKNGTTVVSGTLVGMYNRTSGRALATGACTTIQTVALNDTFEIKAKKAGSDTVVTAVDGVRLTFMEL